MDYGELFRMLAMQGQGGPAGAGMPPGIGAGMPMVPGGMGPSGGMPAMPGAFPMQRGNLGPGPGTGIAPPIQPRPPFIADGGGGMFGGGLGRYGYQQGMRMQPQPMPIGALMGRGVR